MGVYVFSLTPSGPSIGGVSVWSDPYRFAVFLTFTWIHVASVPTSLEPSPPATKRQPSEKLPKQLQPLSVCGVCSTLEGVT